MGAGGEDRGVWDEEDGLDLEFTDVLSAFKVSFLTQTIFFVRLNL